MAINEDLRKVASVTLQNSGIFIFLLLRMCVSFIYIWSDSSWRESPAARRSPKLFSVTA